MIPHSAPWISEADKRAVEARLAVGMIAGGEAVAGFEQAVARYVGAEACIARPSGMDAIRGALAMLGVGPGDEVVLPTYVCESVERSIRDAGATPVYSDVNSEAVLSAQSVKGVMTPATRAIIGVHALGHLCDIPSLRALGVPVVEDACQAFGLRTPWGMAGTVGDLGVYSFHATKCLATGEGGMLVVGKGQGGTGGRNGRGPPSGLSDLQAALGLSQLDRYEEFLARRLAIRAQYDVAFARNSALIAHLPKPDIFLFRYTIRSEGGFPAARDFFAARGVTVRRGIDDLLHRQTGIGDQAFPQSLKLYETTVSIPFYPALTDDQVRRVAKAAEEFANAC